MKSSNAIGAVAVVVALVGLYKNTDWLDLIRSQIYFKPEPAGDVGTKCSDAFMDLSVLIDSGSPAIDKAVWMQKREQFKAAGGLSGLTDDYLVSFVKSGSKALTESMSEMGFLWVFHQKEWEKSPDTFRSDLLRVNHATLDNLSARVDWCLAHETGPAMTSSSRSDPTSGAVSEPDPANVSQAPQATPTQEDSQTDKPAWADKPWADEYRQTFDAYNTCMWNTVERARENTLIIWDERRFATRLADACGDERQAAIDFRMKYATTDSERSAIERSYSSDYSGESIALRHLHRMMANDEQAKSEPRGKTPFESYQECLRLCDDDLYVAPGDDFAGGVANFNLTARQCRAAC